MPIVLFINKLKENCIVFVDRPKSSAYVPKTTFKKVTSLVFLGFTGLKYVKEAEGS